MTQDATPTAALQARIDDLEIRFTFAEDLLESLNTLVARQSDQIEAMGREIIRLRDRLEQQSPGGAGDGEGFDPASEIPPHY